MFLSNYADEAHDRRSENDEKIIDKNEVRLEAGFFCICHSKNITLQHEALLFQQFSVRHDLYNYSDWTCWDFFFYNSDKNPLPEAIKLLFWEQISRQIFSGSRIKP